MSEPTVIAPSDKQVVDLLQMPYTARQKIVVVEDDQLATEREALERFVINLNESDFVTLMGLGWSILGPIGAGVGALLGGGTMLYDWLRDRPAPYMLITSTASAKLKFPHGHPIHKVLYIGHPHAPELYYPMAKFHHHLFIHKRREAIKILKALGATSIEVMHETGWSKELMGSIKLPAGAIGADLSAKGGSKRESKTSIHYKGTYKPPKKRALPKNLVWYPHEDDWHGLVEDALSGSPTVDLTLAYEDSYGVDAELEAEALGLKFGLGGEFKNSESTRWHIHATFGKRRTRA